MQKIKVYIIIPYSDSEVFPARRLEVMAKRVGVGLGSDIHLITNPRCERGNRPERMDIHYGIKCGTISPAEKGIDEEDRMVNVL